MISTREATDADVPALVDVINVAFLVEAFFVSGPRSTPDDIRALMRRGRFLVTPADAAQPIDACVFIESTPPRGYLGLLAVRPGLQTRGLGSALLEVAERALAETCQKVFIRIVDTRPELEAFYTPRGYVRAGTEPFAETERLLQPCRFILMEKPLSP